MPRRSKTSAQSSNWALCLLAEAGQHVRVQVMCGGGIGRTGSALACIAQLAGVEASEAVPWVRAHYHPHAVETPWQQFYVRHLWRRARRKRSR